MNNLLSDKSNVVCLVLMVGIIFMLISNKGLKKVNKNMKNGLVLVGVLVSLYFIFNLEQVQNMLNKPVENFDDIEDFEENHHHGHHEEDEENPEEFYGGNHKEHHLEEEEDNAEEFYGGNHKDHHQEEEENAEGFYGSQSSCGSQNKKEEEEAGEEGFYGCGGKHKEEEEEDVEEFYGCGGKHKDEEDVEGFYGCGGKHKEEEDVEGFYTGCPGHKEEEEEEQFLVENFQDNMNNNNNNQNTATNNSMGGVARSEPLGSNEDYQSIEGQVKGRNQLPSQCYPKDVLSPKELLPKDVDSIWAQSVPAGQGSLDDKNNLNAGFHIGVNTVGQTLRNANRQLRSEPPNPQVKVSPWLQSTIEPDVNRKPLEIGA